MDHIEQISNDLFMLIDRIKGPSSPETVLTAMVETILKAETRSRLHLYMIREALTDNEVLKERFIATYRHWFKTMEEGLGKILPGQSDFKVLATILVAVLDGFVIQSMLKIQNIKVKDIVRYLLKMNNHIPNLPVEFGALYLFSNYYRHRARDLVSGSKAFFR
jgi:hypothetical protein